MTRIWKIGEITKKIDSQTLTGFLCLRAVAREKGSRWLLNNICIFMINLNQQDVGSLSQFLSTWLSWQILIWSGSEDNLSPGTAPVLAFIQSITNIIRLLPPPSSLLPLSLNLIMLFLIRSTSPQSNMKRSVLIIFILLLSHSWEILIPVEREQDFLKDDTFNKRKGTLVTRTAHFNVNFG